MKLLGFTNWKHGTVPLPSSSTTNEYSTVLHRLIPLTTTTTSSSTDRRRKRPSPIPPISSSDTLDVTPCAVLTTHHRISVLGYTSKDTQSLTAVPRWSYETPPDPLFSCVSATDTDPRSSTTRRRSTTTHSFLHPPVGAVVDPSTRTVACPQKHHRVLKIWSLDNPSVVIGPNDAPNDSNGTEGIVQTVLWDSPLVALDPLPIPSPPGHKRGTKKHATKTTMTDGCIGGFIGRLASGTVVVLVKRTLDRPGMEVGVYPPSSSFVLPQKGKGRIQKGLGQWCLRSFARVERSFGEDATPTTTPNSTITTTPPITTITYTTVDVNLTKEGNLGTTLTVQKHRIVLPPIDPSFTPNDQHKHKPHTDSNDGTPTVPTLHTNTCESTVLRTITLPHTLHPPPKEDQTHLPNIRAVRTDEQTDTITLLYHAADEQYYSLTIHASTNHTNRYGEEPIPLRLRSTHRPKQLVVSSMESVGPDQIALLSYVPSTTNTHPTTVLTVVDTRHSVLLYESDIRSCFPLGCSTGSDQDDKATYRLATDPSSGTVTIVRYGRDTTGGKHTEKVNGGVSHVAVVATGRIGFVDSRVRELGVGGGSGKGPVMARGGGDLSSVVASSVAVVEGDKVNEGEEEGGDDGWISVGAVPFVERGMEDLWSTRIKTKKTVKNGCKDGVNNESMVEKAVERLENHRGTGESLSECFSAVEGTALFVSSSSTPLLYPQRIVDVAIRVAIDVLMDPLSNRTKRSDAADLLTKCVRTGQVVAHTHLERCAGGRRGKRRVPGDDNAFRSLLYAIDYNGDGDAGTDDRRNVVGMSRSLCLIDDILDFCPDSITERTLVTMLHYVVCHVTQDQMAAYSRREGTGHTTAVVEERTMMNGAKTKAGLNGASGNTINEAKNGVVKVEDLVTHTKSLRRFVRRQLYFVRKIVTYSECNDALLRTAIERGITRAEQGEVEVLMKTLGKLLHCPDEDAIEDNYSDVDDAPSRQNRRRRRRTAIPTVCIVQWLSALADVHLGGFFAKSSSLPLVGFEETIEAVRMDVVMAISKIEVMAGLKNLLCHVDTTLIKDEKDKTEKERESHQQRKKRARISNSNAPPYSIESLIF